MKAAQVWGNDAKPAKRLKQGGGGDGSSVGAGSAQAGLSCSAFERVDSGSEPLRCVEDYIVPLCDRQSPSYRRRIFRQVRCPARLGSTQCRAQHLVGFKGH